MTSAGLIVPVLRQRKDFLNRALDSISKQTVRPETVLVVSPETTSETRGILESYADQHNASLVVQSRPGFAAAINQGVELLKSKRFGLLLSDDWLEPDAVESCIALDADIVSTGLVIFDETGIPVAKRVPTSSMLDELKYPWQVANCLTHFFLLNKEMVGYAGMFDETLGDSPGIDDFDLIWTMIERSASVAVTERPLYNYTDHSGDRLTLRDPASMRETFGRILKKHNVPMKYRESLMDGHGDWFGIEIIPRIRLMLDRLRNEK